ncbi:Triple functional domain protein [Manis javanica]|nr:Triple functional domain protein [Manis javanica]
MGAPAHVRRRGRASTRGAAAGPGSPPFGPRRTPAGSREASSREARPPRSTNRCAPERVTVTTRCARGPCPGARRPPGGEAGVPRRGRPGRPPLASSKHFARRLCRALLPCSPPWAAPPRAPGPGPHLPARPGPRSHSGPWRARPGYRSSAGAPPPPPPRGGLSDLPCKDSRERTCSGLKPGRPVLGCTRAGRNNPSAH